MRPSLRRTSAGLTLVLLVACTGNSTTRRPSHTELYLDVLTRIKDAIVLEHSLALHPRLGQIRWSERGMETQMDAFNTEDTLVVEAFVSAHTSEFHLCTLTPLKSCDPRRDSVFVILSEPAELAERDVAVLTLLVDHRSNSTLQTTYLAHLKPRGGEWRVVSFRSVE